MILAVLALLLPAVTLGQDDASHDALMDEIEARVVLPTEARPLAAYGRHYAFHGPGRVLAIYVIPPVPLSADAGCSVSDSKGSHECTATEIVEMRRSSEASIAWFMPTKGRRWYADERALPDMSDGGCNQVTIEYDIVAKRVVSAKCNGTI